MIDLDELFEDIAAKVQPFTLSSNRARLITQEIMDLLHERGLIAEYPEATTVASADCLCLEWVGAANPACPIHGVKHD